MLNPVGGWSWGPPTQGTGGTSGVVGRVLFLSLGAVYMRCTHFVKIH